MLTLNEVKVFLDLLGSNAPAKRISRAMNLSYDEVNYHMGLLRYYRRLVEIKNTERDIYASLGGNVKDVLKARGDFRTELMNLFKECKDEL